MDLRETLAGADRRHPWEVARVSALRRIMQEESVSLPGSSVLDVGCGDAYAIAEFCKGLGCARIDAVDANFSQDQMAALSLRYPGLNLHPSLDPLPRNFYDLITLFDVVEHVEDDAAFLRMVCGHGRPGGMVLVTAPAFPILFGAHDVFLRHVRRYRRAMLHDLARRAGLEVVASGYLFTGLLLPRAVQVVLERISPPDDRLPSRGVGGWNRSTPVTRMMLFLLSMDTRLTLWLQRRGITLPGLTTWMKARQ